MHSAQVSPHLSFRYLSGCQNKSFQAKYVLYTEELNGTPSRHGHLMNRKLTCLVVPFGSVCDLAGSEL